MAEISKYILDILLLLVFLTTVGIGVRRGFIKSVLSTVSWLIAALGAAKLNGMVSRWFYDRLFAERIRETLERRLAGALHKEDALSYARGLLGNIPGIVLRAAQAMGIDSNYLAGTFPEKVKSDETVIDDLMTNIADPIVISVLNFINFFLIIFVLVVILKLLTRKLEDHWKDSPFKSGDKLLGGILGAVKGAVIVVLFAVLFSFVAGLSEGSGVAAAVEHSTIVRKIATDNFIEHVFKI